MQGEPDTQLQAQIELAASELLKCLATKGSRVTTKYDYYNADNDTRDFGISTPARLLHHQPGIGWASRAVNTLSDRVVFDGFAKDQFGVNDYFTGIGAWSVLSKAKHDAFIGGCAFVAVADGDNDQKVLIPFTAQEATGEVDQTTGLLKNGLAVTRWYKPKPKKLTASMFEPADYILFMPELTAVFKNRELVEIYTNPTNRCLLHPVTHRASADRPLGKSRLTNTARRIIQEVGRLKRREEIAEEFYALPQRYITGLAEGAKKDPTLDSVIGKVWTINKDEDGDKPDIGQLTQMNIDQFETAKKDKARDFCAETALTLRNLGYETANPSTPESLAAMSDDLLLEATNSQNEMGEQFKQIATTLVMANAGTNTVPDAIKDLTPAWKPIFQVDLGAAGDALFKLFQSMPELQGTVAGYRLLGIGIREAEELIARRAANSTGKFMTGGSNG
jgi:hypothetical protein